jgi:hypothetical protein
LGEGLGVREDKLAEEVETMLLGSQKLPLAVLLAAWDDLFRDLCDDF